MWNALLIMLHIYLHQHKHLNSPSKTLQKHYSSVLHHVQNKIIISFPFIIKINTRCCQVDAYTCIIEPWLHSPEDRISQSALQNFVLHSFFILIVTIVSRNTWCAVFNETYFVGHFALSPKERERRGRKYSREKWQRKWRKLKNTGQKKTKNAHFPILLLDCPLVFLGHPCTVSYLFAVSKCVSYTMYFT